jgi:hypothetical protein
MNAEQAAAELKVLRALMERPIRLSTMSGLSGILAGCAALAGLAADWQVSNTVNDTHQAFWINLIVWAGVFVTAFTSALVLTRLRERRQNMPSWSPVKARILRAILPPFVGGVALTLAIACHWYTLTGPNEWGLIPAIWMLFYGVALRSVGEFAPPEVGGLGIAFLAAGAVCATFFQYAIPGLAPQMTPYFTLGLTFGGFHLVYGAVVWKRYGG